MHNRLRIDETLYLSSRKVFFSLTGLLIESEKYSEILGRYRRETFLRMHKAIYKHMCANTFTWSATDFARKTARECLQYVNPPYGSFVSYAIAKRYLPCWFFFFLKSISITPRHSENDTRLSWRDECLKIANVGGLPRGEGRRQEKTFHLLNFIPRYFLSSFSADARPYLRKTKSPFRSPYRNMK